MPYGGKGMAVAIADKMRDRDGGERDEASNEDRDGMDGGLAEAMSALSSALKSGDSKAAASAFKDAVEICGGY